MDLIWFIGGLLIVFLPLLCGASFLNKGAESGQAFGVGMMVAIVFGFILQFGIFGVDAHIGASALILPLYVGLNFLALLMVVGLGGNSKGLGPREDQAKDEV